MRVRIAATALASLVLGAVSFAAARVEPGYFPGGPGAGIALLGTAAGWAATAAGLLMWRAGRSGPLLALAGTAWLLAACSSPELGSAVVFTAALSGGLAAPALIAHALRPGAAIAAAGYAFAVGLAGVAQALLFDPAAEGCGGCPDNLLLVHADADARLAVMRIGMAGTAAVLAIALLIAAARLHRAPAARRAGEAVFVLPVGFFAAAAAAQLVHGLDRGFLSNDPTDRGLWLAQALALVAAAAGTAYEPLRRRRARADLARLVLELGRAGGGGLREALAARFHDPGLEIAYHMDDRAWIGADGTSVQPPPPDATQLVAGGAVVAAIRHRGDAPLEELASSARLGLEFERLHAVARAQLAELRASRARIVAAGDEERRRLERDLHDGAQQRLLSLALTLGLAQRSAADQETLAWAVAELRAAVAELRELAHGIYPTVLGEEGLAAALESLAEADGRLRVRGVTEQRLPAAVESAAYVAVLRTLRATDGMLEVIATTGQDGLTVELRGRAPDLDRRELEDRAGAIDGTFSSDGERFLLRLPL
jgi:signal transduction histidine kinase